MATGRGVARTFEYGEERRSEERGCEGRGSEGRGSEERGSEERGSEERERIGEKWQREIKEIYGRRKRWWRR